MRSSWVLKTLLLICPLVQLAGCVADKPYRASPAVLAVPPEFPERPAPSPMLPVGARCNGVEPSTSIQLTPARDFQGHPIAARSGSCIAFIEFNDKGKESVPSTSSVPSQADRAIALIHKAIADDPQHQPIILTFIHGWKHNASSGPPEDTNIQGLEHVLDYLYTGFYGGRDCAGEPTPCVPLAGHVVIGIYIAWRGEAISHYWPVARTISVYSREAAAERIGPHIPDTLDLISNTAHPPGSAGEATQPMLVFIGHSFGALVLEKAMTQSYIDRLKERQSAKDPKTVPTFADLVIYINSAAPATDAVPMLNYLAENHLEYREDAPALARGNGSGRNRPLLLSITTPADFATGTLFPIAFSAKAFVLKAAGSLKGQEQIQCYDPVSHASTLNASAPSESSFYTSSAAHLGFIQSHELIDLGPPPVRGVPKSCPIPPSADVYEYGIPGHCFQIQPKKDSQNGERHCNNTPYWILSSDGNIIPDHGTIFTDRLIRFIGEFLPPSNADIISPPRLTTVKER